MSFQTKIKLHKLNIETLRYVSPRIPPSEQFFKNCNLNYIENEFHLVYDI